MRIAGILALGLMAAVTPASAEMFTCHDRPGKVLAVYSGSPGNYGSRSHSRAYTSDYSSRQRYQAHATYVGSRHYWNDRSRW